MQGVGTFFFFIHQRPLPGLYLARRFFTRSI